MKKQSSSKKHNKCCSIAPSSKFCPIHSKVKLVFLLKNGNNHLKNRNHQGKLISPVRYSYLSLNSKKTDLIIAKMKGKLQESFPELTRAANMVIFYVDKIEKERYKL